MSNIIAGTMDFTQSTINAVVSYGDTITYTGTAVGGLNTLTARVQISGSWSSFTPPGSTIINSSYIRMLFLKPGSFDTPNFFAPTNIISQAFYGLGPNAVPLPFGVPYSGFIPSSGTIDLPVTLSSLPEGTQVAFITQDFLEGTMTPGGQGLGSIADLWQHIACSVDCAARRDRDDCRGAARDNSQFYSGAVVVHADPGGSSLRSPAFAQAVRSSGPAKLGAAI